MTQQWVRAKANTATGDIIVQMLLQEGDDITTRRIYQLTNIGTWEAIEQGAEQQVIREVEWSDQKPEPAEPAMTAEEHEDLIAAYQQELKANLYRRIPIDLSVPTVIALTGQLQLALRHPLNTGPTTALARAFIQQLKNDLTGMPTVQKVIDMGFDARFDP